MLSFARWASFGQEAALMGESSLILIGGVVLTLSLQMGALGAACVFLVARTYYMCRAAQVCSRLLGAHPFRDSRHISTWSLLYAGLPFAAYVASAAVYQQVDTIMIHRLVGPEGVGYYQSAFRLTVVAVLATEPLHNAYLPEMARVADDPAHVAALARDMGRHCLILACLLLALGGGWADVLLRLWYGSAYVQMDWLLRGLTFVVFIRYAWAAPDAALSITGRQAWRAGALIAALAISAVSSYVLVKRYAIPGALASAILSQIVLFSAYAWFGRRFFSSPLFDRQAMALLGVAGCGMFLLSALALDQRVILLRLTSMAIAGAVAAFAWNSPRPVASGRTSRAAMSSICEGEPKST
jgi:O-antigen/teichoic acid export membrane protein